MNLSSFWADESLPLLTDDVAEPGLSDYGLGKLVAAELTLLSLLATEDPLIPYGSLWDNSEWPGTL